MARKKKQADEGGGANWMDTYGDLVTLLLCFFVLLYSFSVMDAAKFAQVASSMQSVFSSGGGSKPFVVVKTSDMEDVTHPAIELTGPTSAAAGQNQQPPDDSGEDEEIVGLNALASIITDYLEATGLGGEVLTDDASFTLTIRFPDNIFFDSGSAELRPEAFETLNNVTQLFVEHTKFFNTIRVEGHTDNIPLRAGSVYRDNWGLSHIRAANATRYIYETGLIAPERLSGQGCGEFRPIDDNTTAEGRQKNRRVDFVIDSFNLDALKALAEAQAN